MAKLRIVFETQGEAVELEQFIEDLRQACRDSMGNLRVSVETRLEESANIQTQGKTLDVRLKLRDGEFAFRRDFNYHE